MSDRSTYIAIGVSLLISLGSSAAAYGALDERVDGNSEAIRELKQDRREMNAKLDAILNITAKIAGRLEEQDRADEREQWRSPND